MHTRGGDRPALADDAGRDPAIPAVLRMHQLDLPARRHLDREPPLAGQQIGEGEPRSVEPALHTLLPGHQRPVADRQRLDRAERARSASRLSRSSAPAPGGNAPAGRAPRSPRVAPRSGTRSASPRARSRPARRSRGARPRRTASAPGSSPPRPGRDRARSPRRAPRRRPSGPSSKLMTARPLPGLLQQGLDGVIPGGERPPPLEAVERVEALPPQPDPGAARESSGPSAPATPRPAGGRTPPSPRAPARR